MQGRKIIYLINPVSGTREKAVITEKIVQKTKQQNIPFEIVATNPQGDYQFLKKRIDEEKITDVVICGGDGSVSTVAGSLLDTNARFGIVPLGSGNGLALAAKIPTTTIRALDIIFEGNASEVDGFTINDKFSCMLCGIGFDAQVAHDFAASPTRGLQTYIKISAINFFKAKPFLFHIESKEHQIETEAFFICIANGNQFGNNFTIAPQASLQDGLIDVVIVKKMNKFMLPFSIAGQITGINALQNLDDHIDRRNIIYFQTSSLRIHNPELAPLHVDGDPQETSPIFEINVVPKAFRLLQPFH
jgi:diacylglycerol kinase (ATP)